MEISWDLDKYIGAFNFRVSIDGIKQENSKIVSISGVGVDSKLVDDSTNDKKPLSGGGANLFTEVEIKRVYQGYDQLYNWRLMIEEGIDALRTVSIEILANDLDTVVRKIVLHNAWPHKWQLPNLDSSSTGPAIETISLAYERITGAMGGYSPGDAYAGEGTSFDNTAFRVNDTTQYQGDEEQDFDDSFWDKESNLEALEDRYAAALTLALAQNNGPLDPNEEVWAAPETGDGITANLNRGGDAGTAGGTGPKANTSAMGETQVFAENGTGGGTGPIDPNEESWDAPEAGDETQNFRDDDDTTFQGDGEQDFRENDTTKFEGDGITDNNKNDKRKGQDLSKSDGTIDPNQETWDAPEAGDGITANLKRDAVAGTADGSGPTANTTAMGEKQVFADTGGGTGPIDPNEESWDAPEGGDETQNFRDNDDTKFQGEGEQDFRDNDDTKLQGTATEWADTADDGTPIDPNEESWDAPDGVDDPTAARNGGDGSGPVGGRGAQDAADSGEGSGPIDNEAVDYGGSAAADDPTAAQNGGDGSGPVGGRGAQAEADYGAPGTGPKGGRGEGGGGQTE
jgi:phage tail-like protein